ncbi:hypothetical protein BD289DRAFT_207044 [Coniella lustricola]|uniref:Uncharacterized protein n=1 Tax=Coniella lustricola TaxID=2025994 RepID=A0A2T2ZSB9_9PEZI|nr:hypothetical protein BD289DRAFT_207044 [Coniella lustricola]
MLCATLPLSCLVDRLHKRASAIRQHVHSRHATNEKHQQAQSAIRWLGAPALPLASPWVDCLQLRWVFCLLGSAALLKSWGFVGTDLRLDFVSVDPSKDSAQQRDWTLAATQRSVARPNGSCLPAFVLAPGRALCLLGSAWLAVGLCRLSGHPGLVAWVKRRLLVAAAAAAARAAVVLLTTTRHLQPF